MLQFVDFIVNFDMFIIYTFVINLIKTFDLCQF